jgi:hypothetical protein
MTHARHFFKAAVMGGQFQVFKSLDVKLGINAFGKFFTDPGNRGKQVFRREFALQPFEKRQTTRVHELANRASDAFPDVRQVFELFTLNGTRELSERPIGSFHEACGFSVSIDAIGVCILSFEQGSHPLKNVGNLLVGWLIRSHRYAFILKAPGRTLK